MGGRSTVILLWSIAWLVCLHGQAPVPAGTNAVTGSKEQWNENFRDPAIRRTEADDVLVQAIATRKPGSALDLGMGQGRNALYLAEHGWQTTGVDFSEVAVGYARAEA